MDEYEVGTGRMPFIKAGCDDGTCFTTSDRQWINESDAIIFHARDLNPDDLPPPAWRLPHQLYVFYNYESPVHTDLPGLKMYFDNFFNVTFTYRRDSDIFSPYGRLKCKNSIPSCQDYPLPLNSKRSIPLRLDTPHTKDWKHKNKTIAWFVSNCHTDSRRESIVEQLRRHIRVDIYGKCPGARKCSKCDQMLDGRYRFYLSFENSLCPDYVTEKLYRALAHNVVPVVFGGADYSSYLPKGSYINAMDFKNQSQLADYLREVMSSDALYSSYFEWQEFYEVIEQPLDGWCSLCKMISQEKEKKTYQDIAAWWSGKAIHRNCFRSELLTSNEDLFSFPSGVYNNLINKVKEFVMMQRRR